MARLAFTNMSDFITRIVKVEIIFLYTFDNKQ